MEKIRISITTTREAALEIESAIEYFTGKDDVYDNDHSVTDKEIKRISRVFTNAAYKNRKIS